MNVFKQISTIRFSFIVFCFLIVIIVFLLILFIFDILTGPKWSSIIPGLLTGFVIALFQAFLSWYEFIKIDEYNELKIKKILPDRKDSVYYGDLISKAKKEIKMLGVTAERFLNDFAQINQEAPDKEKLLLRALDRCVKVEILIVDKEYLEKQEHKVSATNAEDRLIELSSTYSNFEYVYYKHSPTHSIVMIDDECIVGPIFPDIGSRYTPAIHLKQGSKFAEPYVKYFNTEWNKWKEVKMKATN